MLQLVRVGTRLPLHGQSLPRVQQSGSRRAGTTSLRCRAEEPNSSSTASEAPVRTPRTAGAGNRLPYSLICGLASVGVAETAYLTGVKLLGAPLVCPTSGCEDVLSSPYSSLFGIPLPFLGMLAYGAVGLLAASGAASVAAASSSSSSGSSAEADAPSSSSSTRDALIAAGATLLASCSAGLMFILHTRLGGEPCTWCYLSAGLSATILAAVASSLDQRQLRRGLAPSAGALVAAVAALYFGYGGFGVSNATTDLELPYAPPVISAQSSPQAVQLAARLKAAGAKMYGAFWCSHCQEQKEAFGQQAMQQFPYVECYPDGWRRGAKVAPVCDQAGVRAFPSWQLGGKLVEGELTLEQLQAEVEALEAAKAAQQEVEQQAGAVALM